MKIDSETKRKIILQHYNNPTNKGLINDDTYLISNTNNESCIDEVNLMVKIDNNIITDIRFNGEACAICTSSTSIMIETLLGKTVEQAREIYSNFEKMLDGQEYNNELLEQANVYNDICTQPSRKKCALLPWWGIKKIIFKNI